MEEKYRTCLRALGDLLMPRACLVCGCALGRHERHLCLRCAADVPYTYEWLSPHNPLADRFNAVLEAHRGTEPADYAYATALMYYKGPYRQIPKALKYRGNVAAGRWFGALLGRRIAAAPHLADVDLVLPVPLHWTRRRSRGYNQAEVLARAIVLGINSFRNAHPGAAPPAAVGTGLLVRTRRTRTQTRLSVEQKAVNVASAFRVPRRERKAPGRPLSSARHILLVDDTFTTGVTLYACYAALRPFTEARISVATLAAVEGAPA